MPIMADGTHNTLTYADPTGRAAVGRASRRHTATATVTQLRDRLMVAVRNDDGAGLRLIAARLQRVVG